MDQDDGAGLSGDWLAGGELGGGLASKKREEWKCRGNLGGVLIFLPTVSD